MTRLAKGRLLFLKDTSCDVEVIARKVDACRGTGLRVFNANTTTLLASLQAGADGYCGISANFYPEMLVEMFESFATRPERAEKLQQIFNLLQRHVEFKYPRYSKQFLHESGLAIRNCCRVDCDLLTEEQLVQLRSLRRFLSAQHSTPSRETA